MERADVIATIEKYKGKPITLGLADQAVVIWSGVAGHWLFYSDTCLVEIRVNTSSQGLYSEFTVSQNKFPFLITYVQYDTINFIRSYVGHEPGDIQATLEGLTPIHTDKSIQEIAKEIESNSVRKSQSVTGSVNDPIAAPGGPYGSFKGSMISTDINGLPQYVKDKLIP